MTEKNAVLGVATLAAVVTVLPAVFRVTAAGPNAVVAFLLLLGGTALVLGPALVLATAIRGEAKGVRAALHGLGLAAAPLSLLASLLKSSTHHRPLGAATFAVLALVASSFFVVVAWRVLRVADTKAPPLGRGLRVATALAALASVAFVVVRSLAAPELVPHVLDGLRALSTAALGYLLLRFPRVTHLLGRAGGPLWVAAVVGGLAVSRGTTLEVARSAAPVLGGPLTWF